MVWRKEALSRSVTRQNTISAVSTDLFSHSVHSPYVHTVSCLHSSGRTSFSPLRTHPYPPCDTEIQFFFFQCMTYVAHSSLSLKVWNTESLPLYYWCSPGICACCLLVVLRLHLPTFTITAWHSLSPAVQAGAPRDGSVVTGDRWRLHELHILGAGRSLSLTKQRQASVVSLAWKLR